MWPDTPEKLGAFKELNNPPRIGAKAAGRRSIAGPPHRHGDLAGIRAKHLRYAILATIKQVGPTSDRRTAALNF